MSGDQEKHDESPADLQLLFAEEHIAAIRAVVQELQKTVTQMKPKEGEMLMVVQQAVIQAAVQEVCKSLKLSDASSGDKNSGT